jgi:hypothetical protein
MIDLSLANRLFSIPGTLERSVRPANLVLSQVEVETGLQLPWEQDENRGVSCMFPCTIAAERLLRYDHECHILLATWLHCSRAANIASGLYNL